MKKGEMMVIMSPFFMLKRKAEVESFTQDYFYSPYPLLFADQ